MISDYQSQDPVTKEFKPVIIPPFALACAFPRGHAGMRQRFFQQVGVPERMVEAF